MIDAMNETLIEAESRLLLSTSLQSNKQLEEIPFIPVFMIDILEIGLD